MFQEDGALREWKKQLLNDKEISYAKQNIQQLREVCFRSVLLFGNRYFIKVFES